MRADSPTDELEALVGATLAGMPSRGARYTIERRLGRGAQATTFLATSVTRAAEMPVVIKIYRPDFVRERPDLADLVLRKESVALARLNEGPRPTPYVVRMLDTGEHPYAAGLSLPWIALEYVHGGPLGRDLKERVEEAESSSGTAPSPGRVRRLLGCVVQGLGAIHDVGVIHRDLKPQNVLVCGEGDDELAKVADFGVSRAVGLAATFGVGLSVGAFAYAAPEQNQREKVGPWSDVFSLAALTYYAIAAERMFQGPNEHIASANARTGKFEPLSSRPRVHGGFRMAGVLGAIDAVLRAAIVVDTAQRTRSAADFWEQLEPLLVRAAAQTDDLGRAQTQAARKKTIGARAAEPWTVRVRHRPSRPMLVRAAAFDPDGHAVAVGDGGLFAWEGAAWVPFPAPLGLAPAGVRGLVRLGEDRWLTYGEAGAVAVFTPQRVEVAQSLGAEGLFLTAACAESERSFAVAGRSPGTPWVAYAFVDGRWAQPIQLDPGVAVNAMAVAGPRAFHLVGSDADGRGVAWTWHADSGVLERRAPLGARLRAAAAGDGGLLCAVGDRGAALVTWPGRPLHDEPVGDGDLGAVAIDPGGFAWAAGAGRVLRRDTSLAGTRWSVQWEDAAWTSRFVGMAAFAGMVIAVSEDGAIVTAHQALAGG